MKHPRPRIHVIPGGRAAVLAAALSWLAAGMLAPAVLQAQNTPLGILERIGIDQNLDAQAPLDLAFRDEDGRTVRLGDYFTGKPVMLSLVYFECPMLCTLVLNGQVRAMRVVDFGAGTDYDVVSVSFDARETPEMARSKRDAYLAQYGREGGEWHFLTGDQESIDRLTEAVGFRYAWDEETQQWAHAAALVLLTPEGRISRYFYGIEYSARDLRLGLLDAAQGTIGSVVDQVLLFCFHYDPTTGRYGLVIMNVIRLLGVATVGGLGLFIATSLARERRARGARA